MTNSKNSNKSKSNEVQEVSQKESKLAENKLSSEFLTMSNKTWLLGNVKINKFVCKLRNFVLSRLKG